MQIRQGVRGGETGKPSERDGARRSTVAAPKLRIPPIATTSVERVRLWDLLDDSTIETDGVPPVTLVCAPAGAGKTMLLAGWARRRTDPAKPPVAWVSLDAWDNDGFLLWSAILGALETSGVWVDDSRPGWPGPSRTGPNTEFLAALIAVLAGVSTPICLVLDNVHELFAPAALDGLNFLLRHLPSTLRIVLVARFPPPLILPRLRIEGRLREIGTRDLAFTRLETELLLAGHGVTLTKPELDLLMERTEGWAAGLRLATMSLVGSAEPATVISGFTGDDRAMSDYLAGEVLAGCTSHQRQLLLTTCACDRFTADLAAVLSQQQDSGQVLDELERTNILISRPGPSRGWYRYHPLLRGYLRAELGRRQPCTWRHLHREAAKWFLSSGDPLSALEHGIAAEDDDMVARLVQEFGLKHVLKGDSERLRGLLDTLPSHMLAWPSVALVAAATALDLNDVAAADRHLRGIGNAAHPLRSQRMRTLHAAVTLHRARYGGDLSEALAALEASETTETRDVDLDLLTLINRGSVALWQGEHETARANLERASQLAVVEERDAARLHCQIHLAAVAGAEGDLTGMGEQARSALDFARTLGWSNTWRCAYLYTILGAEAYQRLDRERARQLSSHAVTLLPPQTEPTVELSALTLEAVLAFEAAPNPHQVVDTLRSHWKRLGDTLIAPALIAYAAPIEQYMALHVGEPVWANEVAERTQRLLRPCAEHALLQAVLRAHRHHTGAARRILAPVLNEEVRAFATHTLLYAWLLEALLAERSGDQGQAHEAVSRALAVAEPRHALLPFHDADPAVRDLLARGVGRFGRLDGFATTVLTALPVPPMEPIDMLTDRERDLLMELPSMRTTEEIADSLYVSANTVKTHMRGIYRKLGVNHRRDAITVARQRGLL